METIITFFNWISANPGWAGVGVFLIAFFESLALVGLILPGAAMMFGIGAMVGTGTLPLWPTLMWAAFGAIAGDGVSFWLGRRYHMQVKTMWPLRNHPELIGRATNFFYRHGGKSILLGRFIGPIRPVIPAVAGMLEMPTRRFLLFNIVSGILWAPVYVFPGMLFATSLGLASEVASRLAVLIGTLLGMLFLLVWMQKYLFNWLHRHTWPFMHRTLSWANRHPVMGEIPAALLDPEHPEARGLTMLALLLLITSLLFALVHHAMGQSELLLNLDDYLFYTLEALRTPWMDHFLVVLSMLGDWQVLLPLTLVVLGWLWLSRHWHALWHWSAAIGVGALLSLSLRWAGSVVDSPLADSLHSAQLMTAMALYGFLAVLIARELAERKRWRVYTAAAILLLAIAFARLYLGAHRLSGVLGALTLGMAWISLLGIAYRHHPANRVSPSALATVALTSLVLSAGWHGWQHHTQTLDRYTITGQDSPLALTPWWQEQWQRLPAYRADLRGTHVHPLNVQYAGRLGVLEESLLRQGWHLPPPLTGVSWLTWLNDQTPIEQLPVLPQVHAGQNESLLLVKVDPENKALLALRLWPSTYQLEPDDLRLWVGNISMLRPVTQSGVSAPRTQPDFDLPLRRFLATPLPLQQRHVHRKGVQEGWSGEVLLIYAR